jgi:hypothetical protein
MTIPNLTPQVDLTKQIGEMEAEYTELMLKYTGQLFLLRWLHERVAMGDTITLWHSDAGYQAAIGDDTYRAHGTTFEDAIVALREQVNKKPGPGHELSGWGDDGTPPGNE